MGSKGIRYRAGYKYQLAEDYELKIGITPEEDVRMEFIELSAEGDLLLRKGYAWDGPSGPAFDTRNFMRGSLVHDALYQLMRRERLSQKKWRDEADDLLRRHCREDGMSWLRAWWTYKAVRAFGHAPSDPASRKPVFTAP